MIASACTHLANLVNSMVANFLFNFCKVVPLCLFRRKIPEPFASGQSVFNPLFAQLLFVLASARALQMARLACETQGELTGLSLSQCQTLATGEFQVQSKESLPKDSLAVLFPLMTLPDSLILTYGSLQRATLPEVGPMVLMLGKSSSTEKQHGTLVSMIVLRFGRCQCIRCQLCSFQAINLLCVLGSSSRLLSFERKRWPLKPFSRTNS